MTEYLNVIIGTLGSLASIIGAIMAFIKDTNFRNKILYVIIFMLMISTTIVSYNYKKEINLKMDPINRKEQIRKEASDLLSTMPKSVSYWDSGVNEGIVLNTLIFLEKNKDFCPEVYEFFKNNTYVRNEKVNKELDSAKIRESLQHDAESALQIIKSLSK